MSRDERQPGPDVVLSLAESLTSTPVRSPWIGSLLALGTRLSRKIECFSGRQLIVVISVPSRDYAAALIGTGWTLGRSPAQTSLDPLSLLRESPPGKLYRAVVGTSVISGRFHGLDEVAEPARVSLAGQWAAQGIEAIAPVTEADPAQKMLRPQVGSIGRMAGIDRDWERRLVAPKADLAIVGTKSWINQDLEAILAKDEDPDGDPLATLLLPRTEKSATWFSRIYSSSSVADHMPLSNGISLVILDGQGAIRNFNDVLAPIVVSVIDRSVADESAAEHVVQIRNSRGEPISLLDQLGWIPPEGVEALGFTVAL